ncbi:MAG: DNA repair protein RadA [Candidatus Azotimanducaceae bacterium]|uniref:DNA repair protein RadA n=1 Tax=OM182 bacterium TaxID=2510334 RepID=A0A520S2Q2_9GAMM|nr:DNA repair protein RadA [Gammaproteobacteria bacterium]OUV68607.1 MAG: DNA repair protein RadA [Gammaproteobacteria bacterium TMED133]RZO76755.1 MAG: DNA repair protein RadA [OM182 bacterium]
MPKDKIVFVCADCNARYAKWQGQCNGCGAWNTLSQLRVANTPTYAGENTGLKVLSEITTEKESRLSSGLGELDRVLGGGMVAGSAILISGNPGAGKSTLLLQVLCGVLTEGVMLYVTGEESLSQVAARAQRLKLDTDKIMVMAETNIEMILSSWSQSKPSICVIDSIQAMHTNLTDSAPGSITQVRESAAALIRHAKQTSTILIMVGHVTKDGNLAGPRILEHMIDTFIMFDEQYDSRYRTLRSSKNRFGAINEVGIFAMAPDGMREVSNPSAIFLSRGEQISPGSVVMVVYEGSRPLLVEAQALVDDSVLGNPRRVSVGFELNRLAMLLAVLHRHGGLHVADQDVFVNAVGGIRINETSSDLALVLAVVSSFRDHRLSKDLIVFGEIGLSGEIRPVANGQERIKEAQKHGFTKAIVPIANTTRQTFSGIEVIGVSSLQEALDAADSI